MIILRSRSFSSKKKTDEETDYQKKDRKGLATTAGILAGGTTTLLSDAIVENKLNKHRSKVYEQSIKHLNKIDSEKKKIDKKIQSKAQEILKNPEIKKEGVKGRIKVEFAEKKLLNENALRGVKKIQNLNAARDKILKRIEKKGLKAKGVAILGSAALGTAVGLAANHGLKKQNKKK